jgi:transcriptional regulator with XRE-family HTH domain
MNFSAMYNQLLLKLDRSLTTGHMSIRLLARKTGITQPHLSNVLKRKRMLSLGAIDKVLAAMGWTIPDLMSDSLQASAREKAEDRELIPVVSDEIAGSARCIRSSMVRGRFPVPVAWLNALKVRGLSRRGGWERFVAVRASQNDVQAMGSFLKPNAMVLIDRGYVLTKRGQDNRPKLFAIWRGGRLSLRYAEEDGGALEVWADDTSRTPERLTPEPGRDPSDFVVGRVALVINEV